MPVQRSDKVEGALLGVHAGDALGAGVEFSSWAQIRSRYPSGPREITGGGPFHWPPGHATDDTDLTRAVLLAYLHPATDVVKAAADHMLDWLSGTWPGREPGSVPRDIGGATAHGLGHYSRTGDPRRAGAGAGRAGNGSLMRCVPTALAVAERERRVTESMEISAVTHDDPRCTVACAAYNETVAALLAGATAEQAVAAGHETAVSLGERRVAGAVENGRRLRLPEMAATGELGVDGDAGGYVLDSLAIAVTAALDPRPLSDVLVDVVRLGNDTDTNAAIAGGLLGARDGAAAIPARWRDVLQFADEFTMAAKTLSRS